MRPDRPPGRDAEGGPRTVALTPGNRLHAPTSPPPSAEVVPSLSRRADKGRAPRGLAEVLALSDERDLWLGRVLDAWRAGYEAALGDAVAASLLRVFPLPGHVTEAEKRRYPPDGREHFADPRPGDYPGRQHD